MLHIASNPSLKGLSVLSPKIVYSTHTGKDITLDLLMPQIPEDACEKRYPLIVFIQGSAWHFPDTNYEIPQLARFADDGFVVASVTHRNMKKAIRRRHFSGCQDCDPFPSRQRRAVSYRSG
ncbi:MAG: hypothetical protein ACLVLH_08450 [Eisenbergiella massiliensis]